ncbi:MAG: YeeE/YedE family protein [Pseudomonadota bacterium]
MSLATTNLPWLLILAGALGIGTCFGLVAAATRYCNMGAVSDWVLTGDKGRLRAWLLSIAVAVAAVGGLEAAGLLDLDHTRVGYRSADFPWLRYLAGGLMFGIGMVLAGGCTTRTLVNIGQGDLKSLWAYAVVGLTAAALLYVPALRMFVDSGLAWPGLNLADAGIDGQDPGTITTALVGGNAAFWGLTAATLVTIALLITVRRLDGARPMRQADIIGGLGIGLAIAAAWLWTGTPLGQQWTAEATLAFEPPKGGGTQSFSFVAPAAEALRWSTGPSLSLLTFGMVAMLGVVLGAAGWFLARREFRFQGFGSLGQFAAYTAGGLLMGTGGIVAMGCSVGQGLSGSSTLALGSLLALGAIILGAWLALKTMLYRALHPETPRRHCAMAILADLHLLPARCHPYRERDANGEPPRGCSG